MAAKKSRTYAGAGVSIDAGDELVDYLKKANPNIGGFSGLAKIPAEFKNPRLLMSTDGVGTKLLVAQLAGIHHTIGIDLVAMTVNDLITGGGRPLYFLDYFATGKLELGVAREVMKGIVKGCKEAGCELVGGETAEMPGMYAPGHYDLAGFGVGVVEADAVIDGSKVQPGDIVLGIASAGLHSNGFSLARKALLPENTGAARRALARPFNDTRVSLAQELLKPTKIYVKTILELVKKFPIRAMAHITGGGIEGNLVRVLPRGTRACVKYGSWPVPRIFQEIARRGPVELDEMLRVFNMGIGFILVAPAVAADAIAARCAELGEKCRPIGWIDKGKPAAEAEVLVLR
jgi:phosphoribosylformylglycinamidine cyclo-ligase